MRDGDPGALNRLWAWFAVSSVVFLAVLAVSPVKDWFREYRGYQNTYRKLLIDSAGSAKELKAAREMSVDIRQIWIPGFDNRVDRCTTCHLGVENPAMAGAAEPFRTHPRTPHTPDDLSKFGCVICHRGQGRATTLTEAHGESPDWDSPLLPIRFTEASCGRCHESDTVPEASLLSEGREMMNRLGCFGCHQLAGHEGWKSEAPDLEGLAQKTSAEWLRAWLKAPRDLSPATRMPDFRLDEAECDALASFLWAQPPAPGQRIASDGTIEGGDPVRGRTLFGESRCVSCHTIEGRGNGSAPELSGIGSKVNRAWLVAFLADPHAFQPDTPMPRYDFSRQDLLDLTAYMMEELTDPSLPEPGPPLRPAQKDVLEGEKLYKRYGCAGCHRIAGKNYPTHTGPELTGIGDKPVGLLDFGVRTDIPQRLPDWMAAKVSEPRSFREGLRMPDFGLAPEQVQAIVTALLSAGRETLPASYTVAAPEADYTPPGRFGEMVRGYRCLSCHQIQGTGGDISKAPLTREGSRVRRDWLAVYLLHPSTIRPILTDRMIPLRMSPDEAGFLADFIENVYVDNGIPGEIFPDGPPAPEIERGRKLFYERYGCQACHSVGGSGGYYGPLLDTAGDRLESGWVSWWLQGPQRWRADVRCPDFGMNEQDARDLAAYVDSLGTRGPGAAKEQGRSGS